MLTASEIVNLLQYGDNESATKALQGLFDRIDELTERLAALERAASVAVGEHSHSAAATGERH